MAGKAGRRRFTLGPDGALTDREGNVLGVLESLTIIPSEEVIAWGVKGGAVDCPSSSSASSSPPGQESFIPPVGVQGEISHKTDEVKVWEHYERVVPGGKRYALDANRRRIIRNALAVRPLDVVLDAVSGLAASPHHLGQNDRRKKYLGIQYALKGKDGESNDERIDKMAAKARTTVRDFIDNLPSAGREMVRDHMNKVAASLRHPGDDNLRARAEGSAEYLANQFGLSATLQDDSIAWTRSGMS